MKNTQTRPALINLNELIGRLISSYQPLAETQKSFFINDVPNGLLISADHQVLATLLGSIFYIVARSTSSNYIHVHSASEGDRASISITDNSPSGTYGILYEFQHLRLLSKPLDGFLQIETRYNKETTITFNFHNDAASFYTAQNELRIVA
ncbi:MAG: hypothetical protein QM764_16910 [Chitinophagaceae bacterium]